MKSKRALKICCCVSAIILIIVIVVAVILFFTIIKPRDPKFITREVTLEYIKLVPLPFHLNVSLGIQLTIYNRNYGSFKYENSTSHVTYRGDLVAEAPVLENIIPARGKRDINTTALVMAEKLIPNIHFWADYASGQLNFTTSTTLHGEAKVLKIFKAKVSAYSTCNLSLLIQAQNVTSACDYKVAL